MANRNPAVRTEYPDRLGKVAANELALNGYTRYDQLTNVTSAELLKVHGIGPKAIRILDEELRARGLSFVSKSHRVNQSLASRIQAANVTLIVDGRLDAVGDFFAPDYVAHLTDQDMTRGHDAIRGILGMYRSAFPDLQVQVEILVEGRDRIAWQRTLRGTHKGAFKGFPATGRPIVWRDAVTSRFIDGLIAEEWVVTDLAERLLLARKR